MFKWINNKMIVLVTALVFGIWLPAGIASAGGYYYGHHSYGHHDGYGHGYGHHYGGYGHHYAYYGLGLYALHGLYGHYGHDATVSNKNLRKLIHETL